MRCRGCREPLGARGVCAHCGAVHDRAPARSAHGGRVAGMVADEAAPATDTARMNRWKKRTAWAIALMLAPIACVVGLVWMLARAFDDSPRERGGAGVGAIFGVQVIYDLLWGRRPSVSYRDYLVDAAHGLVQVRIVGALARGCLVVGHQVELAGHWDGGSLIVERGFNRTLGTPIRARGHGWKIVFAASMALLLAEYALISSVFVS